MKTRILIADNNEIARARLTQLIQSHDYWEVCAQTENGQKALLKAKELKPDIIILDSAMPVMDGLGAAREIGKALPSIPIVLLHTSPTLPSMELEAKKAGIRKVVSKPGTDVLFGVIERLIGPQATTRGEIAVAAGISGAIKPAEKSSQRSQLGAVESHPTHEEIEVRAHEIYVERCGSWTGFGWIGCKQHGANRHRN